MRTALIVLALCVAAYGYPNPIPRNSREEDKKAREQEKDAEEKDLDAGTELFVVPLERSSPHRPTFSFGLPEDLVPPPFEQHPFFRGNPWAVGGANPTPDDDFMTQIQAMLNEMRKQLTDLVHHAHSAGGLDRFGPDAHEGNDGHEVPKNKTTSTTKVIDGHVVTVNETTYSSGNDDIGAVFRVKVVEVHPSETPEVETEGEVKPDSEESTPTTPAKEHEPTTSKSEHEEDLHEETNEIPNPKKVHYEWAAELDPSINEIDQLEDFSVENFAPEKKQEYYNLGDDTKVNDYMSDHQGLVMVDPDAEILDSETYYRYDNRPSRMERFSH